ncbi:IS5 family transposase [Pseudomonas aeruginosa]|uniref:IS5 family transposase n=3 Tax=Pseudomonas aeruginosa TaxID=287 RepID=UPI000E32587A|nr:IS5 family transposase [Pseudomonas aeruginosa]MBG3895903.1 IS5 family transposase [Pseudomonas aeruginosa]NQC05513.1 IS5 family transposase [Pseudomonas aeruginosa]RTT91985.1 IS5 family transposase [Pseudomonas aeruginosa]TEG88254.1 IS5 family transposase [Pseudomonas aeruginosa]HBO9150455.1 IS5 family transposase [Pseudomonas aeruginosa]
MDQITLGLEPLPKKTRKEIFLAEMNQVVPWATLVKLIQPHARGAHQALGGRPPFPIETMLRIHCLQLWWNLSDPAMEEELHERPLYRRFVGLEGAARMPDETTILRFRHLLEKQQLAPQVLATINAGLAQQGLMLKTGTVVDATIIAAPSSTKNKDGERDPEMHQTKKGNQWHFGMKAHIGVDADSGLVHSVVGTAANVNDVTQAGNLLHGQETNAWGDAGYQGVDKREEFKDSKVRWEVALRPGKRRTLDPERELHQLLEKAEKLKASIRAKVEHPFRLVKQQFGYAKVRYRGLAKNTARLTMLFALGNLWMARRQLLGTQG